MANISNFLFHKGFKFLLKEAIKYISLGGSFVVTALKLQDAVLAYLFHY